MIKLLEIKALSKDAIFPVQSLCFECNREQLVKENHTERIISTIEIINIHTESIISTIGRSIKDAGNLENLYTAITSFIACSPSNLAVLEMIDKGEQVDIKFNVLETSVSNFYYTNSSNHKVYQVEMTIFKKDLKDIPD